MPLDRRRFIRFATALGAAALLPSKGSGTASDPLPTIYEHRDDAAYWAAIRTRFPLSREWAYLNTGTLGPSPDRVIRAVHEGMAQSDATGSYNGYEDVPEKLANFLGADADEIALTHNTTEGINIMCRGIALRRGDEVILSTHEHVGNAFPWLNRAAQDGILLKALIPGSTAERTLQNLEDIITPRTRVIAIPHVLCTNGQVAPVAEICDFARRGGITTLIDGAHAPGMMALNLHNIGADAYAGCCHKWMLGPKGTGFLYVRKDFQQRLVPHFVGGGGDTGAWNMAAIPIKGTAFAEGAHRYWGGTQNLGLWLGVGASVDALESIGMARVEAHVRALSAYTRTGLAAAGDRVEIVTPAESRSHCGITGFRIRGVSHDEFFKKCMAAKVRIRAVSENGWNALRVSTHFFNTTADIDRLLNLVHDACKG